MAFAATNYGHFWHATGASVAELLGGLKDEGVSAHKILGFKSDLTEVIYHK